MVAPFTPLAPSTPLPAGQGLPQPPAKITSKPSTVFTPVTLAESGTATVTTGKLAGRQVQYTQIGGNRVIVTELIGGRTLSQSRTDIVPLRSIQRVSVTPERTIVFESAKQPETPTTTEQQVKASLLPQYRGIAPITVQEQSIRASIIGGSSSAPPTTKRFVSQPYRDFTPFERGGVPQTSIVELQQTISSAGRAEFAGLAPRDIKIFSEFGVPLEAVGRQPSIIPFSEVSPTRTAFDVSFPNPIQRAAAFRASPEQYKRYPFETFRMEFTSGLAGAGLGLAEVGRGILTGSAEQRIGTFIGVGAELATFPVTAPLYAGESIITRGVPFTLGEFAPIIISGAVIKGAPKVRTTTRKISSLISDIEFTKPPATLGFKALDIKKLPEQKFLFQRERLEVPKAEPTLDILQPKGTSTDFLSKIIQPPKTKQPTFNIKGFKKPEMSEKFPVEIKPFEKVVSKFEELRIDPFRKVSYPKLDELFISKAPPKPKPSQLGNIELPPFISETGRQPVIIKQIERPSTFAELPEFIFGAGKAEPRMPPASLFIRFEKPPAKIQFGLKDIIKEQKPTGTVGLPDFMFGSGRTGQQLLLKPLKLKEPQILKPLQLKQDFKLRQLELKPTELFLKQQEKLPSQNLLIGITPKTPDKQFKQFSQTFRTQGIKLSKKPLISVIPKQIISLEQPKRIRAIQRINIKLDVSTKPDILTKTNTLTNLASKTNINQALRQSQLTTPKLRQPLISRFATPTKKPPLFKINIKGLTPQQPSKIKLRRTFSLKQRYAPSLAGIELGATIEKAPEFTEGVGIRPIVARKKKRPVYYYPPPQPPVVIIQRQQQQYPVRYKQPYNYRTDKRLPTVMRSKNAGEFLSKTIGYLGGSSRNARPDQMLSRVGGNPFGTNAKRTNRRLRRML
jgi:hypothetical protein